MRDHHKDALLILEIARHRGLAGLYCALSLHLPFNIGLLQRGGSLCSTTASWISRATCTFGVVLANLWSMIKNKDRVWF